MAFFFGISNCIVSGGLAIIPEAFLILLLIEAGNRLSPAGLTPPFAFGAFMVETNLGIAMVRNGVSIMSWLSAMGGAFVDCSPTA
jgi:hypothetical protein